MTPPFRHDTAGTAEPVWARAFAERQASTEELVIDPATELLVVLAAHPDDETLGAGGLVRLAHRRGIPVHVVVATDGEGSHPHSPTTGPAELSRRRRAEAEAALAALAPDAGCTFLGLPDGGLTDARDRLAAHLVGLVGRRGGRALLCAPWRGDGHADHEAAGLAAAAAAYRTDCRLIEYPIWLWHWGGGQDVPWADVRRLPLDTDARSAKATAVAEHRSQTQALSDLPGDEVLLGPDLLAHFERDAETFLVDGPVADDALERLHADEQDPWGVDTRWYERRKRALTLGVLPRERYADALELGCSVGALAADLAQRCDRLLAVDASAAAVARATERLAGLSGTRVARAAFPDEWPDGTFDLVVMSEVGYFLSPARLERVVDRIEGCLAPDGDVVLCHWRPAPDGLLLDGDAVHEAFRARDGWASRSRYLEDDFVLEVLSLRR